MIKRYKKKPIVIEALQWTGNFEEMSRFCPSGAFALEANNTSTMCIPTLEGTLTVSEGDYIIKGVKGEVYPCKPDIFHMTYEEVQDASID